jgi:hypothetical protein
VLRIDLGSGWDKLSACCIGAENPRLPWRAELYDSFEKRLLILFAEKISQDATWNRLGTASGWHLGFICNGLLYNDLQASAAKGVTARQSMESVWFLETLAAADARAVDGVSESNA